MANKFVPIDQLKEMKEWVRLTADQREMVTFYIEKSGYDKVATVKKFFKCATEGSTRTSVGRQFGNEAVKAFLALHFCETPQEQFLEQLRKAIANPKLSYPRLQALRLQAKILGLSADAVAPEGRIVAEKEFEKDGKRFKTTVTEMP